MKYILAIDQGTTGSRAIIYDKRGKQVASAYREFRQYFPRPGWVEHDPEEIWESVRQTIQKVVTAVRPQDIAAIGITNQRETTVVWDRVTGKPVHHAIVWQCRRTAARCDRVKKRKGLAAKIRQKTGLPVDAYFSATKIEWILKNVRGARRLARTGRLAFGTTDTWVLWKLTGGMVHATDYTNASRTMLFNIEKKQWDPELLRLFSIPRTMLPAVQSSSGKFGVTKKTGKLPANIPIAGIAGDQQAALFGQACYEPGTIKNTYGTGAFLLLNTGTKRIASRYGLITTLGCGSRGEPVYVLEGAIFIAGAAIQWLRDGLGIIKKARESERMARSVPSNEGVYFVPAFVGLGAPYWEPGVRGLLTGLTRGTRREHLVRAAIEAMCYQTKDVLDAMKKDSHLVIRKLKVDGGAVANDFLCEFQAALLGIAVVRPKIIETTSLGAAYLAGLAVGVWKSSAEIKKYWQQDRIFSSAGKRKAASAWYRGWQQAVQKAR